MCFRIFFLKSTALFYLKLSPVKVNVVVCLLGLPSSVFFIIKIELASQNWDSLWDFSLTPMSKFCIPYQLLY